MGGTINETEENLSEIQLNELKDDVLEAVRMCKVNFETHLKESSKYNLKKNFLRRGGTPTLFKTQL